MSDETEAPPDVVSAPRTTPRGPNPVIDDAQKAEIRAALLEIRAAAREEAKK